MCLCVYEAPSLTSLQILNRITTGSQGPRAFAFGAISCSHVARAAETETHALPASLAEYAAFVHLELAAIDHPPQGVRTEAFVLPLIIAARHRVSSTEFRRYALGWRRRAGSLTWIAPEMSVAASLAVASGSTDDAVIEASVKRVREVLDDHERSGLGRFRDLVRSDHREMWHRAASASAPDAKAWAEGFMR